jgi:hypothetical protein
MVVSQLVIAINEDDEVAPSSASIPNCGSEVRPWLQRGARSAFTTEAALDMMKELSSLHPPRGTVLSGFGRDRNIEQSVPAGLSRQPVKTINVDRLRKTRLEPNLQI